MRKSLLCLIALAGLGLLVACNRQPDIVNETPTATNETPKTTVDDKTGNEQMEPIVPNTDP